MSKTEFCYEKNRQYFSGTREDIINLIPNGNHRILEVGCGEGRTLRKLKGLGKANETIGIEINEKLANRLVVNVDKMIIGDVESLELDFETEFFDYIIFGDILEHLINPSKTLNQYKKFLNKDGYIIASIPNIKYFKTLLRLIIFDEFKYVKHGILDESHIRFFTEKEIRRMFKKEKYEITSIKSNLWNPIQKFDDLFFNIFTEILPGKSFLTQQYIIKAKKKL